MDSPSNCNVVGWKNLPLNQFEGKFVLFQIL